MPTKKKSKKKPEIDIKIRNLDKNCCNKKYPHSCCGGFWVFGSALAMILSYTQNTKILYAILHGILSWFYILFRAMQIWGWF